MENFLDVMRVLLSLISFCCHAGGCRRRPSRGNKRRFAGDDYRRVTSLLRQQARLLFSLAVQRRRSSSCLPPPSDCTALAAKSRSGDEFHTFASFRYQHDVQVLLYCVTVQFSHTAPSTRKIYELYGDVVSYMSQLRILNMWVQWIGHYATKNNHETTLQFQSVVGF